MPCKAIEGVEENWRSTRNCADIVLPGRKRVPSGIVIQELDKSKYLFEYTCSAMARRVRRISGVAEFPFGRG